MTDVAGLGGGYAAALPDPAPTVEAVLRAARPGVADAHLAVIAGPPGVGKSAVAARLVELVPNAFYLDKDITAGGFILQAARDRGIPAAQAYGSEHYHQHLRPLEYAGPMAQACANLSGSRLILLVGGWGPELAVPRLWTGLRERVAPARLSVIHLDAPPLPAWQARMAARGPVSDPSGFAAFARSVTSLPVWKGATRIATDRPLAALVQAVLDALATPHRTR